MQTSEIVTSESGEGCATDEMTYPYAENTNVNWNLKEIRQHDANREVNNGYPALHFQDVESPVHLDPAVVSIELVIIEAQMHFRLSWQPVEEAQS